MKAELMLLIAIPASLVISGIAIGTLATYLAMRRKKSKIRLLAPDEIKWISTNAKS